MADGILGELEGALSKALPYALPAALGAGLGGPLGAIAGEAASQPDPNEALDRQKKQLDIQSEQMSIQGQQATQEAEKQIYANPGFQAFAAKALGIDPKSISSFAGMPLKDLTGLIGAVTKLRSQKKSYGLASWDNDAKVWKHQDLQTGEWEQTYEPASAKSTEEHIGQEQANQADADARAAAERSVQLTGIAHADARAQAKGPDEWNTYYNKHKDEPIDDVVAHYAAAKRAPSKPTIKQVGNSLFEFKYNPSTGTFDNSKLMDVPKKYGSEFATFAEGYVDKHPGAQGDEISQAYDKSKALLKPAPSTFKTIYNTKDPSKTRIVKVGADYTPPADWTLNKPRSAPAPKPWTAADALNARTKARADVIKRLTVPGTLYGSTPPPPDVVDTEITRELLSVGLDKNGKKLPTGYSVTVH